MTPFHVIQSVVDMASREKHVGETFGHVIQAPNQKGIASGSAYRGMQTKWNGLNDKCNEKNGAWNTYLA